MKTIGLLGGMSWESTQIYYRELNQRVNQRLGGLNSAQIIMVSVNFSPLEQAMKHGDWDTVYEQLLSDALKLEQSGADMLVIATNTMHKLAPLIEQKLSIPLIHIADAVGTEIMANGHTKVGLLGTRFTMQESFYKLRLLDELGIEVIIPDEHDQIGIDQVIFNELCRGQLNEESKQKYLAVINKLHNQGAQAIILGCTEIGLLVQQEDTDVPLFDATFSHIKAVVDFALSACD